VTNTEIEGKNNRKNEKIELRQAQLPSIFQLSHWEQADPTNGPTFY